MPDAVLSTANILGASAALASTVSFTPQAWRIIRTGDTRALSTGMYVITVAGFCLWTAYGVVLGQWPLVVSNSICLLLSGFILVMKLLPRRQKQEVREKVSEAIGKSGGISETQQQQRPPGYHLMAHDAPRGRVSRDRC